MRHVWTRIGADGALAGGLAAAALVEAFATGGEGAAIRGAAVAAAALALAWRRRAPLLPLPVAVVALAVAGAAGHLFDAAHPVVALLVMLVGLFSAGRYVSGGASLAFAGVAAVALAATRVAFDSGVGGAGDAVLTFLAVPLPLLVGRWAQGQWRLRLELERKAAWSERARERNARLAADAERMRIAGDLEAAVAGGLREIAARAERLPALLAAGDHAHARELLAGIAATARAALADVRRVLGILRRDGAAPLEPAATAWRDDPGHAPAAAAARAEAAASPADALSAPAERAEGAFEEHAAGRRLELFDGALVAVLLAGAWLEHAIAGAGVLAYATSALVAVPLLARRTHPVAAGAAVMAAVVLQSAVVDPDAFPVADIAALICASYAVGAYAEPRRAIAGLVLLGAAAVAHAIAFHPDAVPQALVGGVAVPWTLGRIARGTRELTREARERAAQVERTRDAEARAAVTAERMRVARELHDAVAHSISVIAIQAAGADGVAERDPARAAQCAVLIEEVARDAHAELLRIAEPAAATPPAGLARVPGLVQRARDAGLPVDVRIEGEPDGVPPGVDLAAFRIVQEALANASKHAGGARASVAVRYGEGAIEIEVTDDGRAEPARARRRDGSGHGIAGMRERAALYGGTFAAGRSAEGGFEVRARLPLEGA